jgi:hypothetical protein
MVTSGALGLGYSITKDLLRVRRREELIVRLTAERIGASVHLRLKVRPVLGAGEVTIKRCIAIRWEPAAGCIAGEERPYPEIRFRPLKPGPVILKGTQVAEWTATINVDRLQHFCVKEQRRRDLDILGEEIDHEPPAGSLMHAIEGGRQMQVAAVVVTSTDKEVLSNKLYIPPLPPFRLRWLAWRNAGRPDQE